MLSSRTRPVASASSSYISTSSSSSYICRGCRRRAQQRFAHEEPGKRYDDGKDDKARAYSTVSPRLYQYQTEAAPGTIPEESLLPHIRLSTGYGHSMKEKRLGEDEEPPVDMKNPNGIRAQLRKWQQLNGDKEHADDVDIEPRLNSNGPQNIFTRLAGENDEAFVPDETEQHEAMSHFMQTAAEDAGDEVRQIQHLLPGDLCELHARFSDQSSGLAIFVRRLDIQGHAGALAQFVDGRGKWTHAAEKEIMYAVPHFIPEALLQPILPYLPSVEDALDMEALVNESKNVDLSVPRNITAPIVNKIQHFSRESKEIFRKHASTLDNAHAILAHDSDLRYGSLQTAASTLLGIQPGKLTEPAIFAVRQALSHAGFAFDFDRRSHRRTGYMQIRSKGQVEMVESVRDWLRAWQDDKALAATMDKRQLSRHNPRKGVRQVHSFLQKARRMVLQNRKNRQPTLSGTVSPSETKLLITPTEDCVQIKTTLEFTDEEQQIVRFLETWSLTRQFKGHARLEALPPLILQATGLYPDLEPGPSTGVIFLQEIGTVMPYENKVRFDPHLLLPSSQHSKPLQQLMGSLLKMGKNPDFHDSMAGLRKDWGDMPVYCIDSAGAHEIDDGISVEPAGRDSRGRLMNWVHVHIANPTAFFSRDHPLAKMARHMGESIYMPERTYMMLPRWCTQKYFSLAPNRPCLTFSTKLDHEGNALEHSIQAGFIRNVVPLTVNELDSLLGGDAAALQARDTVIRVGGDLPPGKKRSDTVSSLTADQIDHLKVLRRFSEARTAIRRREGGLFFDQGKPQIEVWQSWKMAGLGWDHPHRKGMRTVVGDPIIQLRSRPFSNWFAPAEMVATTLVRECMLLACETAAKWCAERQIPGVFRGSVYLPGAAEEQARFVEQKLEPLWQSGQYPRGEYPMHLGMQYLHTFGETQLSTTPFKHRVLGMDAYGKVTSPLRRYGDMILHWQIEAALRQEARLGHSLRTSDSNAPREFLPFSTTTLNTIHLGLQPRELLISKAKTSGESFWIAMCLFRAFHYNETVLPLENGHEGPMRVCIHATNGNLRHKGWRGAAGTAVELNLSVMMGPRRADGTTVYGEVRQGDVWETRIVEVEPIRLVERAD